MPEELKKDITELKPSLDDVVAHRSEDIKQILTIARDSEQGHITSAELSRDDKDLFVRAYDELRSMLPAPDRSAFSDRYLRSKEKDEKIEAYRTSLKDFQTNEKYDREKADVAVRSIQDALLYERTPSAVLSHLIRDRIKEDSLDISLLKKRPENTAQSQYDDLKLAYQKLAIATSYKYEHDRAISDRKRQDVINESIDTILEFNRENADKYQPIYTELEEKLLSELCKQINMNSGELGVSLHNVDYNIDLSNDPVTDLIVKDLTDARDNSYKQAIEDLRTSLNTPPDKLYELDCTRGEYADKAEAAFFSDPTRCMALTLALRNSLTDQELTPSQEEILSEARQLCDEINAAKGTDQKVEDYYEKLEWDINNDERNEKMELHKQKLEIEERMPQIRDENKKLYDEISQVYERDIKETREKYELCKEKIKQIEEKPLSEIVKSQSDEVSNLYVSLSVLEKSLISQSREYCEHMETYAMTLPPGKDLYWQRHQINVKTDELEADLRDRTKSDVKVRSSFDRPEPNELSDRALSFNAEAKEILISRSLKNESDSRTDSLLERPHLTANQIHRFNQATSIRAETESRYQKAVSQASYGYTPGQIEVMNRAIQEGRDCDLVGFKKYAEKIATAKKEYSDSLTGADSDLKEIYSNHLKEISSALDKFNIDQLRHIKSSINSDLPISDSEKRLVEN